MIETDDAKEGGVRRNAPSYPLRHTHALVPVLHIITDMNE